MSFNMIKDIGYETQTYTCVQRYGFVEYCRASLFLIIFILSDTIWKVAILKLPSKKHYSLVRYHETIEITICLFGFQIHSIWDDPSWDIIHFTFSNLEALHRVKYDLFDIRMNASNNMHTKYKRM